MWTSYLLLLALPWSVTSVDTRLHSQLVLALANEFNAACVRILHSRSETIEDKRNRHTLMKSMMNAMREHRHQRFYTAAAVTFQQFAELRKKFRGQGETCYKPLEIVMANVATKEDFTRVSTFHSMATSKWLIFVNKEYNESTFLSNVYVPFDAQVIIATVEKTGFSLSEVFHVNRTASLDRIYLGYWLAKLHLRLSDIESIYSRRNNLKGLVFRTGSIQNWPVSGFVKGVDGQNALDGFFPRVWSELEKLINISSINLCSDDNSTGDMNSNGVWSGLVAMLLRGDINVIVSELNMNEERKSVMDFTHPLLSTRYNIYFKISGYDVSWRAVLNPFDKVIWIAILAWVTFGAVVLAIFYIFCRPYQATCDLSVRPYYTFFFMLQTMCQQGYSQVPSSVACRIIFLLAYLMSAIIIPSYSASLVSSLTAQIPSKPFDSLEEMLQFGRIKLLVPQRSAEYAHFAKSEDGLYAAVFEKLVKPAPTNVNNSAEGASKVCKSGLAIFGVETTMDIRMEEARRPGCDITKLSQSLSIVFQCMGLIKGSPYTGVIDYYLAKMFAAGIIDRIRHSVWPLKPAKHDSEYKQVSLSAVFQIFVSLTFGIVISIIILCMEIVIAKVRKPKKRNDKLMYPYSCEMFYNYPQYFY